MNNIHKLFSEKTRTVCLLDGNSMNGDHCTHGPTYSMAGVIGTTAWQKGFICRCHYLCCHSQWKSLVTCPYLSTGCGLRFICAQSHSDNGHVHATAPRSAHALTQAHPTISCIPLVIKMLRFKYKKRAESLDDLITCAMTYYAWFYAWFW